MLALPNVLHIAPSIIHPLQARYFLSFSELSSALGDGARAELRLKEIP